MPRPILHWMPRVDRDIEECLDFIAQQPWGKPADRALDIYRGIELACASPEANRPEWRRRGPAPSPLPAQRLFELTRERLQKERILRHHASLYPTLAQRL
jgi:hypothetical protein